MAGQGEEGVEEEGGGGSGRDRGKVYSSRGQSVTL
jgi:hypothetical protein